MILRALSEELGCTLPYDSLEEVRIRAMRLAPHIRKLNYLEAIGFADLAITYGANHSTKLKHGIIVDSVDVMIYYYLIRTTMRQM